MQVPFRLVNALRLHTELGLVAAMAVAMATFSATPLVLAPLAAEFDVTTGTAALFSAAQLGAFVVGSWSAGRFVEPSRRLFVATLITLSAANLAAAVVEVFALLVVTRMVSGLALGVLTWLAYSQVFGDDERTGDITTVGPLTAVVSAPLIGVLLAIGDVRTVFAVLAGLSLLPLVRIPRIDVPDRTPAGRNRAVRAALVVIVALSFATFGGSAVFVFMGAIAADQYGMGSIAISLAFSANALVSIPSARYRGRRRFAGAWFAFTGACAVVSTNADQPVVLWVVLCLWGAAFWMAVPGSYTLLAERSRFPTERAGDAQAAMAFGRAIGPLAAGALVTGDDYTTLGVVGGATLAAAGAVLVAVEVFVAPISTDG
ncbi:MAG: MFS transporter [Actinomycetota bacterium]